MTKHPLWADFCRGAAAHASRLSRARVVARALNLDEGSPNKAAPPTPKQFIIEWK